jgi:serine kinase of HPr protein (carbohydrate metabolism regulator)
MTQPGGAAEIVAESAVLHGTAVALGGVALLLCGPSGSGKSDLALRLIDQGAALVADDRVEVMIHREILCCRYPQSAPAALAGMLELRGIGIVPVRGVAGPLPVQWIVDLVAADMVERMPEPVARILLGRQVPVLRLAAFEASATAKLRLAAARGPGLIMSRE